MVKQTLAGLVAVVAALGMTTAVYAQTPAPKTEDKKPAEATETKTEKTADKKADKKAEKKAAPAKKEAKAPAAKVDKDEKPAEAKK
jgi:uncharacterized protein HemX